MSKRYVRHEDWSGDRILVDCIHENTGGFMRVPDDTPALCLEATDTVSGESVNVHFSHAQWVEFRTRVDALVTEDPCPYNLAHTSEWCGYSFCRER